MNFAYPGFLLLLILIPLFFRNWQRNQSAPTIQLTLPPLKSGTQSIRSQFSISTIRTLILVISYLCLVIALARPQTISKSQERKANGIDIVMVLDVSLSMLIQDMGESTRMDLAKSTFKDFIEARSTDRIGFVIFSGEPLTLAPPTLDYGLILQQLTDVQAGGGGLRDGTAIGDGLALAINRLKKSNAKSRVIILLTDGDSNVGRIDPLTAGELALGYGVKVYSIAIGTEGRVRQPLPQQTPMGTVYQYVWVENRLNPGLLKDISEKTNGKFFRVTDDKALQEVFSEIDQLEKTKVTTQDKVHYDEQFMKYAAWALLLLALERLTSIFLWRQWA